MMQGLFLFQFKPGIKDIRLLGRTYGKKFSDYISWD